MNVINIHNIIINIINIIGKMQQTLLALLFFIGLLIEYCSSNPIVAVGANYLEFAHAFS